MMFVAKGILAACALSLAPTVLFAQDFPSRAGPQSFAALIKKDAAKWKAIISAAGIKAE